MAQVLGPDKIPNLTEAGGTITMPAGARLTIGGQQYTTSSALTVSPTISLANTFHRVYAVISGGVPVLTVSTNNNSVGPAGFSAWKLVGHFYSGVSSGIFAVRAATVDGFADLPQLLCRIPLQTPTGNIPTSFSKVTTWVNEPVNGESTDNYGIWSAANHNIVLPRDEIYDFQAALEGLWTAHGSGNTWYMGVGIFNSGAGNVTRGFGTEFQSSGGIISTQNYASCAGSSLLVKGTTLEMQAFSNVVGTTYNGGVSGSAFFASADFGKVKDEDL